MILIIIIIIVIIRIINLIINNDTEEKKDEGQSKIIEPYFITFESSKMDIYLDDISLQLYVIYFITKFISVGRLFVTVVRQQNVTCQRGAFTL